MTRDLRDGLPELADVLSGRIATDLLLGEVIEDLKKASAFSEDASISATERAEWAHIKSELINELRRMLNRNL